MRFRRQTIGEVAGSGICSGEFRERVYLLMKDTGTLFICLFEYKYAMPGSVFFFFFF